MGRWWKSFITSRGTRQQWQCFSNKGLMFRDITEIFLCLCSAAEWVWKYASADSHLKPCCFVYSAGKQFIFLPLLTNGFCWLNFQDTKKMWRKADGDVLIYCPTLTNILVKRILNNEMLQLILLSPFFDVLLTKGCTFYWRRHMYIADFVINHLGNLQNVIHKAKKRKIIQM